TVQLLRIARRLVIPSSYPKRRRRMCESQELATTRSGPSQGRSKLPRYCTATVLTTEITSFVWPTILILTTTVYVPAGRPVTVALHDLVHPMTAATLFWPDASAT